MEYITLTRDDPEFESYLLGTFSRDLRALPVETFHPQTARERVTFRLVPRDKVAAPAWWKIYFWSCRPELLALTMGPAMAAWLSQPERVVEWTQWPSWFALLGVFFLHTGAFLMNDVQDHLRGLDRLNRRRGSQVIQKGWVSARAMKRWALVNFALAILFGVPAFLNAPLMLSVVCGLALVCMLVLWSNRGVRWGASDIALGMLFGPLLTSGIALASFGVFTWRDVVLGVAFGAMTAWVLQVRQFENLFRARPEGFRTILGYWGFDKARIMCLLEGALLLVVQPAAALMLDVPFPMFILFPVVSVPLILFIGRLRQASSPLSSSLVGADKWALGAHLSWTAWWLLALGFEWL